MKKYLFLLFSVLSMMTAHAQVREDFIYYQNPSNDWDTLAVDQYLYFDINGDGDSDLKFVTFEGSSGSSSLGSGLYTMNGWESCCYRTAPLPGYDNIFFDLSLPLNDTSLVWSSICSATQYSTFPISYKVGLRVADGEHYYYGWVECEQERSSWYHAFFHLSKTCFCTIPDFPLQWGQTDITSIGENESTICTIIYPNPTSGHVTITGKDLKSAQVLNTLGQRVSMVQGQGETLRIDIANLPSGVYFVNILDEEGRKCVRKVVKK